MFSCVDITYKTMSLWHQTAMGEFRYFEVKVKLASSFFLLMFYEQDKNNSLLLCLVSWPGT